MTIVLPEILISVVKTTGAKQQKQLEKIHSAVKDDLCKVFYKKYSCKRLDNFYIDETLFHHMSEVLK